MKKMNFTHLIPYFTHLHNGFLLLLVLVVLVLVLVVVVVVVVVLVLHFSRQGFSV
jgi:O-antigen ligase